MEGERGLCADTVLLTGRRRADLRTRLPAHEVSSPVGTVLSALPPLRGRSDFAWTATSGSDEARGDRECAATEGAEEAQLFSSFPPQFGGAAQRRWGK